MTLQVAQFLADLRYGTEQLVRPPLRQWIRNCEPDHLALVYLGSIFISLAAEHSGAVRDGGCVATVEVVLVFNEAFRVLG
jgi:hypothetical protein